MAAVRRQTSVWPVAYCPVFSPCVQLPPFAA